MAKQPAKKSAPKKAAAPKRTATAKSSDKAAAKAPAKDAAKAKGAAKAPAKAAPAPSKDAAKAPAKATPGKDAAKAPAKAKKPSKPTRPSLPLPPPPPPPPAQRDELAADRDVGRLLHYGEKFGAAKIDTRWLQAPLPIASTSVALCDPGVPRSWRELDRPAGGGAFRMMLSVARTEGQPERLAALVVHVGRPPIMRWTVAHWSGHKRPRTVEQIPRIAVTTGWLAITDAGEGSPGAIAVPERPSSFTPVEIPLTDGRRAFALPCANGEYAAYWAIDAADKPVCLVIDLDAFTLKEWRAKPPA